MSKKHQDNCSFYPELTQLFLASVEQKHFSVQGFIVDVRHRNNLFIWFSGESIQCLVIRSRFFAAEYSGKGLVGQSKSDSHVPGGMPIMESNYGIFLLIILIEHPYKISHRLTQTDTDKGRPRHTQKSVNYFCVIMNDADYDYDYDTPLIMGCET